MLAKVLMVLGAIVLAALCGMLAGLLLQGVMSLFHDAEAQTGVLPCHDIRVNAKGTNGAAIAVSTAVVPVVDANASRCRLTIVNETANAARCAETTGKYLLTPSATVGLFVAGNSTLALHSQAAQQAWSCIRQGGTDTAVSVAEDLP